MVHMMVTLGIYLRRWHRTLHRWFHAPKTHAFAQVFGYLLVGFSMSAAALANYPQPLTLAILCACGGWQAVLIAGGGILGYLVFWGNAGTQAALWLFCGLPVALLVNRRPPERSGVWIPAAMAGLIVALLGLGFQIWLEDDTPLGQYVLRILLAIFVTRLYCAANAHRDPVLRWMICGTAALALAQICPIAYLGFGYLFGGGIAVMGAFPAVAITGLALDLAQITPIPMTAVLCLGYFFRLLPIGNKWLRGLAPGMCSLLVMALLKTYDLHPLPGLLVGGLAALLLPQTTQISKRRGETGFAQVRLEMAAAVLRQTGNILADVEDPPVDESALIARAADRACSGCPCRKNCKETPGDLPTALLHKPLGNGNDLPLSCRKSGRLLQELRRSQEQLRTIRADRDRRQEYRAAVTQQYRFLGNYLQALSDALSQRDSAQKADYQPEIAVCSASRQGQNGDRCYWFAGVGCRYYILLCDGMGTGPEAAADGKLAGNMLKQLLCAGFPPEYALRSINSLCALQGRAGAVTVDLAELRLDNGSAVVYKWGAAPSYVLHRGEPVRIGKAAPPPGLSITEGRETVEKLSLRRGEMLVLLSDGAGGEETLRLALADPIDVPSELAAKLLAYGQGLSSDDATVAVVRLNALPVSVS